MDKASLNLECTFSFVQVFKMGEENAKFEANNQKLEQEVGKLSGEVNKLGEENNKFAENNAKLEASVTALTGEVDKFSQENEKLAQTNKVCHTQYYPGTYLIIQRVFNPLLVLFYFD